MSLGGTQGGSTMPGLPQSSTAPGMGGLGIGGGIYGNPFQVNQMSYPNALQGGMGMGMTSPWMQTNPLLQPQVFPYQPGVGRIGQQGMFQQPGMGLGSLMAASPMQPYQNASMFQGRGAMLNQPQGMNSAGLGSLIPGNYMARR